MKVFVKLVCFISIFSLMISCKKETSCEGCATKNNKPPIAIAGPDRIITLPTDSVSLDGSNSSDPDGSITIYLWTKLSGPASVTINKPSESVTKVETLTTGIYQFELKVTDNGGLFTKDTMQIVVNIGPPSTLPACDPGSRPLINAQLIAETTIPSGSFAGTIGNKMLFLVVQCGNHCEDTLKSWAYFNIYDIVTQTWSVSSDHLMTTRGESAMVTAGNKLIYAGGYKTDGTTYSTAIADVDVYDVSTNTWSVTSLSTRKYGMAPAVINNKVFFAGGYEQTTNGYPFTYKVEIYDLLTNAWSITYLSEARGRLSAVALGDKIYFAGGFSGNLIPGFSNRIDIYDNNTNTWSVSALAEPKALMASIAFGNKIFWAGGVDSYSHDNSGYSYILTASVEIKDANAQSSVTTCLFQPNLRLSAALNSNKIVFFGGDGYYTEKNKFDIYDLTTSTWSIGALPVNIQETTIVSISNTLYVPYQGQIWKLEF